MTKAQVERIARFKRDHTVKGTAEIRLPLNVEVACRTHVDHPERFAVVIGWERSRDGRDMETTIDYRGRTIETRPVYA